MELENIVKAIKAQSSKFRNAKSKGNHFPLEKYECQSSSL